MTQATITATDQHDTFLREFMPVREELLAFTFSLLPSHAEAEDTFQEASLLLWKKFDTFQSNTNFRAWARKIIYYKVLSSRGRNRKEVIWSPEVFEALDQGFEETASPFAQMKDALSQCLGKLSDSARRLVSLKYEQGSSIQEMARKLDRSTEGTKSMLYKIRRTLANCVRNSLHMEGLQ